MTTAVPRVARKSITVLQQGSMYKEHWTLGSPLPDGTTTRQEFRDSAGALITEITGTVDGYYVDFSVPYSDVEHVPNGAGFYTYVQIPEDDPVDEHMIRYGTVFRRQLFFPDSPAIAVANIPRRYEDDFQRPAGPVGGRWVVLVGRPVIYDNTEWFSGDDHPNTVGNNFAFFTRYFMRYYQAFTSDTITLSISLTDKGAGSLVVAVSCASDGSSYQYVRFDGLLNEVELGIGSGPNVGLLANDLDPQTEPISLEVPGDSGLGTYKVRYDDATGKLGLYNDDYSVTYTEWTDSSNLVPHGKGYRYFGIGGQSAVLLQGVQAAYIRAQDDV
jgi:hypothetical protein